MQLNCVVFTEMFVYTENCHASYDSFFSNLQNCLNEIFFKRLMKN
ncbi:hypothetical protein M899_2783 [Bacteriovorax sp. BSW11_IV]|nr:hypothetical protein M899_2783 [Bacteriovorax sp. BSW11_IV]